MALTSKQEAFINEYLKCRNAAEAARRAGYSIDTARSIGHENLTKPDILAEIQRRTKENAMEADEVLSRLADHARGSMEDFVKVNDKGQPLFDFVAAQEANKLHLIKKLKTKTRLINIGKPDEEESNTKESDTESLVTEVIVEFELYDGQAALVHLGKHHGLFSDKLDVTSNGEQIAAIAYIKEVRPANNATE